MRILLLTQKLPLPLEDGYNLRIHHYAGRIGAAHELHLLSLDEGNISDEQRGFFASVRTLPMRPAPRATGTVRRVREAFSPDHLHDFDPLVMAALEETLAARRFDAIWAVGWKMLVYTARTHAVPVFGDIIDAGAHEAWGDLWRSRGPREFAYRLKSWIVYRRYERRYFRHTAICNFVAEADERATRKLCLGLRTSVVHNGVDTAYFAPPEPAPGAPEAPALVFEGSMRHRPNMEGIVHFCRHTFPLVLAALPGCRLWVVGRDPGPEVRALASPAVTVTGFVEDVRPYLARASVFVSPLVGGAGIKNKILQAWAMAKPVVATPVSSGGLMATDGENIRIAGAPEAFARACVELLGDAGECERLGAAGRRTVLEYYSWDSKARELEGWFERISASGQPAGIPKA